MRTFLVGAFILLICSHAACGLEYTDEERAFREEALAALKPYGPGYDQGQREIWQMLIGLAASHEDEEIVRAMFAAGEKADGVMATQFDLDMFELYKQNPAFFARTVKKHFKGGIEGFLPHWINEIGDVSLADVMEHAGEPVTDPVLKEFVEEAVRQERIPLDTQ
jgi:hypothetical protein